MLNIYYIYKMKFTKGYIYLLKMCDTLNRTIYKVGKSINFYKRFKSYHYAEIITFIISEDIHNDEKQIIKKFNKFCKLDTGKEFFIAKDDFYVIKLFLDYFVNKNNKNISEINNNSIINNIDNNANNIEDIVIDNVENNLEDDVKDDLEDNVEDNLEDNVEDNVEDRIENVVDDKKIIKIICPNIICKKEFKFISLLKKHLLNSYHCNKDIIIDEYILEKKQEKNNLVEIIKDIKCTKCNITYTRQSSLNRHINTSKCNKEEFEIKKQIDILQKKLKIK